MEKLGFQYLFNDFANILWKATNLSRWSRPREFESMFSHLAGRYLLVQSSSIVGASSSPAFRTMYVLTNVKNKQQTSLLLQEGKATTWYIFVGCKSHARQPVRSIRSRAQQRINWLFHTLPCPPPHVSFLPTCVCCVFVVICEISRSMRPPVLFVSSCILTYI